MKLGCISWSYRNEFNENGFDLFSWVRHCSRFLHLDGVELWNNHFTSLEPDYLSRLKSVSQEEGLPIYSVASKCQFGDFTAAEVSIAQDTLKKWLYVADYLGAPLLRISVGGNDLRKVDHQVIVFESLAEVVSQGEYPNVKVGIENQEPGIVQNATDVENMDRITHGRLKLVLDNGSIVDKSTVLEFMERTIPYAAVIHLKFFDIDENGADRVLNYSQIVSLIKASGYQDFLSIEFDSPHQASEDVPKIVRFLRAQF